MRRRLLKYLPIVVIALMVQILAPIAACRAASIAAADPLAAAFICHDGAAATGQSDPSDDQSGSHQAHDCGSCLSCATHAQALLDPPQVAIATPIRHALRVFWHPAVQTADRSDAWSPAQARGPPRIS
jgi:hypothetical protein